MRLWLVRHAAPHIAPGLCYGQLDVAADLPGTHKAAQALAHAVPPGAAVRCSTLQRCELLALNLQALRPDLTYKKDPRLMELDFGQWEGQPWDAIARSDLDHWSERFATYRPGGGENLVSMLGRIMAALHSTRRQGQAEQVWIAHAGVARCVHWLLQHPHFHTHPRLPQAHEWTAPAPEFGQWQCLPL